MVNSILGIKYNGVYRFQLCMIRISDTKLRVELFDVTTGREITFNSIKDANSYALAVANMNDIEEAIYYRNYNE